MMVGPVEPPRHRTVTALRSSQLSLSFSALCCLSHPPQDAVVRPVIAAIRAWRSILLAETSVSGQSGPTLLKSDGWLLELSLSRDCDPSRLPLSHHQFS